jgi:hypothetical protein
LKGKLKISEAEVVKTMLGFPILAFHLCLMSVLTKKYLIKHTEDQW